MADFFRNTSVGGETKPTRHYSRKQEKSVAKAIGGRTTPNSGATPFVKGDVTDDSWLIECKTCVKEQKTFSMKEEWFEKNTQEAIAMRKEYTVVVFSFGPDKPNYYCVDENTFNEMKQALEQVRNSTE